MTESVNHPGYYQNGAIETIEKIKLLLTREEYIGFLKGNIIKYEDRAPYKGEEEDIKKAEWYVKRLEEELNGPLEL